ncbi:unnamed protein product [Linum trigynum]|uniref:Uncharacterized protein n=1 Tax=Linum trigynum TaxID=586398 RepID=A0AAV2G6N5_9ROSI
MCNALMPPGSEENPREDLASKPPASVNAPAPIKTEDLPESDNSSAGPPLPPPPPEETETEEVDIVMEPPTPDYRG